MPSDYNDRALHEGSEDALPKPQIEIIVDGNSVFKPSMKTYFVDDYDTDGQSFAASVMGEYCTCDTVATAYTVCTCEAVAVTTPVCTTDGVETQVETGTETTETVCTCDSVCTCESVCSCDGYQSCSCDSNTGGGGWVSCGSPCACVPVH